MGKIGDRVTLTVLREQSPGLYLDAGGELGEVLLPRREMPEEWEVGGEVEVFLYRDSQDRPVATTLRPTVAPGEFGYLKVLASTDVGAFLDWGLIKDLLMPFREQRERLEVGNSYVVHVHVDEKTDRIVASRRLARYLSQEPPEYAEGEEVDLLLYGKTDLGYKAIINGKHSGVLFANEVFRRLRAGEKTKGYITNVREDGKIDLSIYAPGRGKVDALREEIERELAVRGGFWNISDSSPSEVIHRELGVSKKVFKKAIGGLYRDKKILIEDGGIRVIE